MTGHKLNFTCPRCGHKYASAFSTGPRAVCPSCKYDPTFMELMDSQREPVWPYAIGLLLLAVMIVAAVYYLGPSG
jgi:transposase-like protein